MTKALSKEEEKDVSRQMEMLTSAFNQFSEETERLEKAYEKLQNNFRIVSTKLGETDERLQKKMLELDLVTHYLQNIVTHISEGILFIGQSGVINTYNNAAEKILGVKQSTALFHNFWDFFPDDLLGFSLTEALTKNEAPSLIHFCLNDKELEVSISFVSKGPKTHQGVVLLFRDITEIRRLQVRTQLHDRMKELGEMAAFVAHEIRNPLGGILGFASLLKRELEAEEKNTQKVDYIIEGTKILNQLVENVLHYARPLKLKLAPQDLRKVIHKLIDLLNADLKTPTNVTITSHLPPKPLIADILKYTSAFA